MPVRSWISARTSAKLAAAVSTSLPFGALTFGSGTSWSGEQSGMPGLPGPSGGGDVVGLIAFGSTVTVQACADPVTLLVRPRHSTVTHTCTPGAVSGGTVKPKPGTASLWIVPA